MLELGLQFRDRISQLHGLQIMVAHIKADEVRLFLQGEEERLLPLVDAHRDGFHIHLGGLAAGDVAKADGNAQVEQAAGAAGVAVPGLGLGDGEPWPGCCRRPSCRPLCNRGLGRPRQGGGTYWSNRNRRLRPVALSMARSKVDGFYRLVGMVLHKGVDGLPEQLIPQLGANHVVDTAALFRRYAGRTASMASR